MNPTSPDHDPFERALRTGPRPVKLPTGFHLRMENAWRHAPEAEEAGIASWFESLWRSLAGPAVAFAALALVVTWLQFGPSISPVPRADEPTLAGNLPGEEGPAGSRAMRGAPSAATATVLASVGARVEDPYTEEARLILDDATRALRFAASQLLTDGMVDLADRQGLALGSFLRES